MIDHAPTEKRMEVALKLAPRLAEKFDFSSEIDYDSWADKAFIAADAFIKKANALAIAARAKEESKPKEIAK